LSGEKLPSVEEHIDALFDPVTRRRRKQYRRDLVLARDEAMMLEGARRLLHWQMENIRIAHLDVVDLDRLREIVKGG
jgi:hypothetical protein